MITVFSPGRFSVFSVLIVLCAGINAAPLELFVGPGGDDANAGRSAEMPFVSLAQARDAIRAERQAGRLSEGAIVSVSPGMYTLDGTLEFTAEDAGTVTAPTIFRSTGSPGKTRLTGGPAVNGFKPWEGNILKCDLKGTPFEGKAFSQLFFKGRRMPVARTPNEDPEDIHGGIWAHAIGNYGNDPKRTLRYGKDIDPTTWKFPETARVGIFCRFDWRWNRLPVKSVDTKTKCLNLARNATYEITPGDRYFVYNVFEELDAPGEWYLDTTHWTLYFWPPEALTENAVTVSSVDTLVSMTETAYVRFEGFTFEGSDRTAITISNSQRCGVRKSIIKNTSGWGIAVEGGSENTVEGCDISYVGQGGIRLSGGDRAALIAGENSAVNNVIHHNGIFEKTYNTGINIGGVGNRAAHNLIYDTPHAAMTLSGNDNIVEYNIIHHTNLQSTDTGGLYSCPRDWTQRGNIIRYNIWHDIGGFGKKSSWSPIENGKSIYEYPHFTWGIYMDDPTSGNIMFGNILYRVPICGLHNHGGRDCVFENNIIVDCPAFQAGMLSPTWKEWPRIIQKFKDVTGPGSPYFERYPELKQYGEEHPEEMSGIRFARNIIYYTEEGTRWLREHRDWGTEQLLYTLRERKVDAGKNVFEKNLIHVPESLTLRIDLQDKPDPKKEMTWEEWQASGRDQDSILADPLFLNPADNDFRLKPESPAWKLGFQKIPVEKIGPFADAMRASWPIHEESVATEKAEPVHLEYDIFEKVKAQPYVLRNGSRRTARKLTSGEPITVAYFGGGIHGMDGWRGKLRDWFTATFPKSSVRYIDAGICDCVRGSGFSVYRFEYDVLNKDPDLILVDFASADAKANPLSIQKNMEGIVRMTRKKDPAIDIVFLYAFRAGYEEAYTEGICPSSVSSYEIVAEHYGVPSINMGYAVANAISAGTMLPKGTEEGKLTFAKDGVRPSPDANKLYTTSLLEAFGKLLAQLESPPQPLAPPLMTDNTEYAHLMPVTEDMLNGEWEKLPVDNGLFAKFAKHFDCVWSTTKPGSSLTFTFSGTDVSLFNLIGPDTGRIKITVDGKDCGTRQSVDRWCYYNRLSGWSIASNLEDGEHTVTIELLPETPDRSEPIAEAKRLDQYKPEDFEGVAFRLGWIRVIGNAVMP